MAKRKGSKGGSEADAARATSGRKASSGGGDQGGVGYPIEGGGGSKKSTDRLGGKVGKKSGC